MSNSLGNIFYLGNFPMGMDFRKIYFNGSIIEWDTLYTRASSVSAFEWSKLENNKFFPIEYNDPHIVLISYSSSKLIILSILFPHIVVEHIQIHYLRLIDRATMEFFPGRE